MRLVILLVIALAVSAVQCVTACAGEDCGAKSQPCHQHDSSSQAKCVHEIPAAETPAIVSTAAVRVIGCFVDIASVRLEPSFAELPHSSPHPPLITLRV